MTDFATAIWTAAIEDIAREAFEAGCDWTEDYTRGGLPDHRHPDFDEWWAKYSKKGVI